MASIDETQQVIAGVRCVIRAAGPSDRDEAIVFVHGNPGSGEDWLDLLAAAGDLGRAIAPDMPGYGGAERPADFDYSVPGYRAYLSALLDALGVRRVHLVLHDFGGAWGLSWAAEHPDAVASLTLINVGALPGYRWHKFARIWRTPVLGELFQLGASRAAFRILLNADNPKPFPEAFVERMFRDADWPMKRGVLRLYRATPDIGALTEQLAAALKPLHLKTLVVWGEGDKFLPVTYAEVQKQYFDAEVHRLPGCGHWPMVDEPERVRELVIPFLRARLSQAG